MKYGSVCSGIESASVAWEQLGWSAAWFSEIEPFPSAVLAHLWPATPNLGDMCRLPDMLRYGLIEAPDVLVGGTPCQAFSIAGMREGLDDERGQLTIKFVEVANEIDKQRSAGQECIIVWENVPGVLSSKDNAFGCFLAALVGEDDAIEPSGKKWTNAGIVYGSQRTAAWRILDAQYFGVAQRRRRVFVIASAREGFDPATVLFEFDGLRRDTPPSREEGQEAAGAVADSSGGTGIAFQQNTRNELRYINGDGKIAGALSASPGMKQQNYLLSPRVYENHPADSRVKPMGETASTVSARWVTGGGNVPLVQEPIAIHDKATRHRGGGADRKEDGSGNGLGDAQPDSPMYTLTSGDKHAVCIPVNTQVATRHNKMGKGTGMGVGKAGDPAYTLQSAHSHAICTASAFKIRGGCEGGGKGYLGSEEQAFTVSTRQDQWLHARSTIRRLTPIECERLQGFPDNHTQIPWRKKPQSDCPDGHRYKAIGNSKAVPVIKWIGERIQNATNESKRP